MLLAAGQRASRARLETISVILVFALRFKNGSGAYENGEILNWNEEWTDWQYVSGAVIAPCAYTGIRFNVDYEEERQLCGF